MSTTTKTIYGGLLQTNNFLGKQYQPLTNTTFNERWNVHHQTAIGANDRYAAEFFCIGNGGHKYISGAESIPYLKTLPHRGTDGGLFKIFPFIVRPINADLGNTDRAKYGMRVPITVAGVKYWAYYLKRLDLSNTTPQPKITTITSGVSVDSAFVPDNSTLTPQAPEMSNTGVIATDGRFASVSAIVNVTLDSTDISELIDAVELIYGAPELAFISEIGIVSAIRKVVPLLDQNLAEQQGLSYNEALRATMCDFVSADFNAYVNRNLFTMTLDFGTSDPMFGNSSQVVVPGP